MIEGIESLGPELQTPLLIQREGSLNSHVNLCLSESAKEVARTGSISILAGHRHAERRRIKLAATGDAFLVYVGILTVIVQRSYV